VVGGALAPSSRPVISVTFPVCKSLLTLLCRAGLHLHRTPPDRPVPMDKGRGRSLKFVAIGLMTLTLTSCSNAFDAMVFNPCDQA
jgi:hypothetical protein